MSFLKILAPLLFLTITSTALADETSKKACEQFLPAFGDQNIDLINNGFKRDLAGNDAAAKKFYSILKSVEEDVGKKSQERCDKGIYPIMDLSACYDKCKGQVAKEITGNFAWNVQDRMANTNLCYSACTGAYVAQNAITKTMRKIAAETPQCGDVSVFDSRKSKQIEKILINVNPTDDQSALSR